MPTISDMVEAAQSAFFIKGGAVYPGLRAAIPTAYLEFLTTRLLPLIKTAFKCDGDAEFDNCTFSMVTIRPADLAPNQRVPHTDENDEHYLAFIHYLCDETLGGTQFFRHIPTGFERITRDRAPQYNRAAGHKLAEMNAQPHNSPTQSAQYFQTADDDYEIIYTGENKFNRIFVYSGANLHSGNICRPEALTEDPKTGRLTITGFLRFTNLNTISAPFQSRTPPKAPSI